MTSTEPVPFEQLPLHEKDQLLKLWTQIFDAEQLAEFFDRPEQQECPCCRLAQVRVMVEQQYPGLHEQGLHALEFDEEDTE